MAAPAVECASMVKLAALAVVAVVALGAGGTAALDGLRERAVGATRDGEGQSGSQISSEEFLALPRGVAKERARELLGAPESRHTARVEGVEVECWYYGIAAATGSFQLCFVDGLLSSRFRYPS